MATERLSSASNPRVQAARRLHRRAGRDEAGRFLIEGPARIAEAIESGVRVLEVFATERSVVHLAQMNDVPAFEVTEPVIRALSDTVTPQGAVAVADIPQVEVDEVVEGVDLVVVLAEVRDPGNAGTLVRSAEAAGAGAVIFSEGSVDPYGAKTVRAAAASLFRVPCVRRAPLEETLAACRSAGLRVVGAETGGSPVTEQDLVAPFALVLGNEAWGLGEARRSLLDEVVGIPMPGPTESLNVAVAGSVILFEAVRQRRTYPPQP